MSAFPPDGKTVAAGEDGIVSLSGHKVADMNFTPTTNKSALSVAFSPHNDGMRAKAMLAAAGFTDSIYLWDTSKSKSKERLGADVELIGHRDWVKSLA